MTMKWKYKVCLVRRIYIFCTILCVGIMFIGFQWYLIWDIPAWTAHIKHVSDRKLADVDLKRPKKRQNVTLTAEEAKKKHNVIKLFVDTCSHHSLPIFLIDQDILSSIMSASSKKKSSCRFLCSNIAHTVFGIIADNSTFKTQLNQYLHDAGFLVKTVKNELGSPAHYFVKPETMNVTIQLVVFRTIGKDNFWIHDVYDEKFMEDGTDQFDIDKQALSFGSYAGAYNSQELIKVTLDGVKLRAVKFPNPFIKEIPNSRFISCNKEVATEFMAKYGDGFTDDIAEFREQAYEVLKIAQNVLDQQGIPFWISSGTCLGWYRQCDVIPYSGDVDIGIFIKHFDATLIPALTMSGLPLKHLFGTKGDSFELSFQGGHLKLDIFFFYEEDGYMWNGGTQARTGKKFKYIFPKFTMCWTEFIGLKVRVPCETESYLEANYGQNWFEPVKHWDWKKSPPNVRENGEWPKDKWDKVIKTYQ